HLQNPVELDPCKNSNRRSTTVSSQLHAEAIFSRRNRQVFHKFGSRSARFKNVGRGIPHGFGRRGYCSIALEGDNVTANSCCGPGRQRGCFGEEFGCALQ